ncbi:uncharacterized protein [Miscanthus floridulus]|uniref:uncharacterized protein n=1 Tax=Miscanthus floridulus TaxID=154761 RepID=UPI0034581419
MVKKKKVHGHELENRWVMPYNPYLLRLFNCHINVEACGSIKAVKYLFKYIYKGYDWASVAMREADKEDSEGNADEIKQYRDARWLHLPDMHMVSFHRRQGIRRVLDRLGADKSMLTAYFEKNRADKTAQGILYRDFPEFYTWTVDGKILPTFREAAERRSLIEEDNTLNESLAEATGWMMPYVLRRLFATILVFCEPSDVFGLWEKHKEAMSEDYRRNNQSTFMKDIKMYPLPDIDDTYDASRDIPREIFEEASIEANEDSVALSDTLNEEQRATYDEIMSSVETEDGGLFFVDSPGETEKTYLYRALVATIHS